MTTTTVTVGPERAEYLADSIRACGLPRPLVDGGDIELTEYALDELAGLSEDSDGHYDGTHIWIQGDPYQVGVDREATP